MNAFRRLLLWSPVVASVLGAVAIPGGLVILALPLLGFGYAILCFIAWTGGPS
jgi:hypothetical protein